MAARQRYVFLGAYTSPAGRKRYRWGGPRVDSRAVEITCDAVWFWSQR
jgi:hypothetical protein